MTVEVLKKQVEFMTERFQECMKMFDDSAEEVKNLSVQLLGINDKIDQEAKDKMDIANSVSKVFEAIEISKKQTAYQISSLINSISEVSNQAPLIAKEIENSKSLFKQCDSQINDIISKISSYDFANAEDVKPLYIEIGNLNKKLAEMNSAMGILNNSLFSIIQDLRAEISPLPGSFQLANKKLDEHDKGLLCVKNDISNIRLDINNLAKNFQQNMKIEIANAIGSIPEKESISLDDVKKAISSWLESASLDAKNANLRSSNNETKVLVLEKKLEQMNLLITKLSLQS